MKLHMKLQINFLLIFKLIKMKENYQLTGQKIQGYTISKPIGQGKFSIVYRAENEQGQPFALKKIKIFDMADQKQREKCLKEVDLMKPLNHPNIIKYIDSFIHNNELIIVTQWAEKGDLKKLIKERESDDLPFDQAAIWEYMRQISSALKHMHEKRIMHRDLKPANIFISHDNTLKIGDLGLGRSFSSQTLEAYSKVGTPLYMSPQLIQDQGYNQNADIWSLGCICYELAELKSPFRNQNQKMSLMDLFENITKCNYKPIAASKYSPQLTAVIKNMIIVDPSKRWSSEQVYNQAVKYLQTNKKPLLDSIIAMDDIHIKLGLLNYETMFCKIAERKPMHKLYFALQDKGAPPNDQLHYFLELCYWIMALSKPQKKDKLPLYTKTLIDWSSEKNACQKILVDLNGFGIKCDQIQIDHLLNGYGQSVCYLLNQVLNRELIRMNFQFKKPISTLEKEDNDYGDQSPTKNSEKEIDEDEHRIEEESAEEQSQFQQSIFFNKHNRKGKIDGVLLQKIEEFDNEQDKAIIYGRADQREWKSECLRLQKQFNDITLIAKQARKKHGYTHIETSKICSSKLTDLIKYVQPVATTIFKSIDDDLIKIKQGQNRINSQFSGISEKYSQINQQSIELNNKSAFLANYLRDNVALVEKLQEKIDDFNDKISICSNEAENSQLSSLKEGLTKIEKEIREMEQKKQILSWQLRNYLMKEKNKGKDDYLEINYFEEM